MTFGNELCNHSHKIVVLHVKGKVHECGHMGE